MTEARKPRPLTRAKALKLLGAGADPLDERFTKHANKHVRVAAAKKVA